MRRNTMSIVYVHPWELVDLPRYDVIPKRVYWRTGEYTRRTFESMVSEHADRVTTIADITDEFDVEDRHATDDRPRGVAR